jgi:hypothetical protein
VVVFRHDKGLRIVNRRPARDSTLSALVDSLVPCGGLATSRAHRAVSPHRACDFQDFETFGLYQTRDDDGLFFALLHCESNPAIFDIGPDNSLCSGEATALAIAYEARFGCVGR